MPNRIIKESICTSDNLNGLSPDEEVLFYRLLVNCDDYGRLDARPAILRARCFPLRIDTVKESQIQKWLQTLINHDLVYVYEIEGQRYLQVKTWERHQQIRAKRSKYPEPDGNVITDDSNGNQMITDVPVIQSESESNPNPNTYIVVFDLWNQQKIVQHKKITSDIKRAIDSALKDSSQEEVCQAIKNYAEIVSDDRYYFKYKWTLKDFLHRGLEKFMDIEVARENYIKEKGGQGGSSKGNIGKLPETYETPEEYARRHA